jgi:hypothetical protein
MARVDVSQILSDGETVQVLSQHVSNIPRLIAWGFLRGCRHAMASSVFAVLWPARPNEARVTNVNLLCDEEVQ